MSASPSAATITVFLLDDHEIVRRGLHRVLECEADIHVVGESGLAREATELILRLRPDVAILDARLPDGSGFDVCRELRSRDASIAVLILTSYDDDVAVFAAIMAGAAGYVLKQVRPENLISTVRLVAAGKCALDPAVTHGVLDRLRKGPAQDFGLARLTVLERRILGRIGDGRTNREIADEMQLAEKAVKNHVSTVFAKLGLTRRTQAAAFAARHDLAKGEASRGPG